MRKYFSVEACFASEIRGDVGVMAPGAGSNLPQGEVAWRVREKEFERGVDDSSPDHVTRLVLGVCDHFARMLTA